MCPVCVWRPECNVRYLLLHILKLFIIIIIILLLLLYVICISECKHMCGMFCMWTSEDNFHDNDFLSPQVAKMGLRETGLHGKCFYCKTTLLIFLTSKHWKWSHHALAKAWTCRAVTDNETARQQRAHPTYIAAQVDPKAKVPRDTRDWKWLNNTWFHLQNWKKTKTMATENHLVTAGQKDKAWKGGELVVSQVCPVLGLVVVWP